MKEERELRTRRRILREVESRWKQRRVTGWVWSVVLRILEGEEDREERERREEAERHRGRSMARD